jgi:LPXTG-motif cell wall-anchored protein
VVELGVPVAPAPAPAPVPDTPEVYEEKGVLGKVGTRKEAVKPKVGTREQTTTPVALVQAGGTDTELPTTGYDGNLPLGLIGIAALAGGYLLLRRTHTT